MKNLKTISVLFMLLLFIAMPGCAHKKVEPVKEVMPITEAEVLQFINTAKDVKKMEEKVCLPPVKFYKEKFAPLGWDYERYEQVRSAISLALRWPGFDQQKRLFFEKEITPQEVALVAKYRTQVTDSFYATLLTEPFTAAELPVFIASTKAMIKFYKNLALASRNLEFIYRASCEAGLRVGMGFQRRVAIDTRITNAINQLDGRPPFSLHNMYPPTPKELALVKKHKKYLEKLLNDYNSYQRFNN